MAHVFYRELLDKAKGSETIMSQDALVREQLLALLRGGNAHQDLQRLVTSFPLAKINAQLPGLSYTPWRLLEHIRIAQWDILAFIQDQDHVSPPWPEGYWPPDGEEADAQRWKESIDQYQADLQTLQALIQDPDTDLYAPLPQGEKYTVLREILLVADHAAYHVGELGILRHILEAEDPD
jgi:hypothetical protein